MYKVGINYFQHRDVVKVWTQKLLQLKKSSTFCLILLDSQLEAIQTFDLKLHVKSRDEFLQLTSEQDAV